MIVPSYGSRLDVNRWSPIVDALLEGRYFVLTTHENSDGDGLGSEVALALALRTLGREVKIVNPTEVPPNYTFLKESGDIKVFNDRNEEAIRELSLCDIVVLLDANLRERMGALWPHVQFARELGALRVLCIDHHLEPEDFADIMVCESYASSTGELVYDLILALEEKTGQSLLTSQVAEALYTAVMTDTGSFRFPKTTPYVYRLAGDLVSKGADPSGIYDMVYNSLTPQALKLLGVALSAIAIVEDGRLASLFISQEMMKASGSKLFDTDLVIKYLLSVSSVLAAVLMVELPDGRVKVSFRSRGSLYVNRLAKRYGGGGHKNAAGCLLPYSADKARRIIHQDMKMFLDNVQSQTETE